MSVTRHTVYNVVGATAPIVATLVTVPAYLAVIGLERYGLLSVCWLFLGYFMLFDFGLGRAVAQRIAQLGDSTAEVRNRVFWAAAAVTGLFGAAAALLMIPAANYGLSWMNYTSPGLQDEAKAAVPWLAAAVPLGLVASLLNGALEGRRAFLAVNLIGIFSTLATALLPLGTALLLGPTLPGLVATSLVVRLLATAALAAAARRAVPILAPTSSRGEARTLLGFGGWAAVTNIVGPLLSLWDRFVIGLTIGTAAVAVYVVPFSLVSQLALLPFAFARALFPRLAGAAQPEARELFEESARLVVWMLAPVTMGMLLLVGPFLEIWLGRAVAEGAAPIAYILLIGFWINGLAQLPIAELHARSRPRVVALAHVGEIVPYAILLFLLLAEFGVAGAALAWTIRATFDAVILFALARARLEDLRPVALQGILLGGGIAIALLLPVWSVERWLLLIILAAIQFGISWASAPPRVTQAMQALRGLNPGQRRP